MRYVSIKVLNGNEVRQSSLLGAGCMPYLSELVGLDSHAELPLECLAVSSWLRGGGALIRKRLTT